MVGEWLGDAQDLPFAVRVGDVRVRTGHQELGDHRVAVKVRVIHKQAPIGRVLRVESESEQSPLTTAAHPPHDVEEWPIHERSILDDADPPSLFGHEDATAAVAGVGDIDRCVQPVGHDRDLGTTIRRIL